MDRPHRGTWRLNAMTRGIARNVGIGILFAALVAVIEMRYAEPIRDSDLFWHLAYAQQMLERHTLIPDPTLYSWTPTRGGDIYCAWLSELGLYGLWTLFGLPGLFALRYLVIAAVAGLFWTMIRRARLATGPATLLALLMLVVTAYSGSLIKPELFSLLFFHAVLWCYFRAKIAARVGSDPRPWLYAVPLLTLVWANAHGGHVLLAPLLAASALGEAVTRRLSPRIAFSGRQYAHLLTAWALCAVAICITPYGMAYPLQNLAELAAGGSARPDTAWNVAHLPIYADGAMLPLSQPQLFAGLTLAVLALFAVAARRYGRGARIDYALALALLAYLPLSVQISRASFLWPALACYSIVYLAYLAYLARTEHDIALRPALTRASLSGPAQLLAAIAFAPVSTRVAYDAIARPDPGSWLGFGIGYVNPVPETEYLVKAKLGPRFYNTYDSGGYLLWRLYPRYRVMVDPRSFPYLDWFDDQYRFTRGEIFSEFLARYPADLAVIDLKHVDCWRNFVRAPDWRLLFYGPTAVIFARHDARAIQVRPEAASELLRLQNARTAFIVLDFAVVVGDYSMAWNVLEQLETTLARQADTTLLHRAQTYRAAHAALAPSAYDEADVLFEKALAGGVVAERDLLIRSLLRDRRQFLERGDPIGVQNVSVTLAQLALPRVPHP
jgi:hypothetical protein